jgi:small conductance mechanosensitive channel
MTQPLKQWSVAREYRRRLKRAFDEAGIEPGYDTAELLQRGHARR